MKDFQKLTEEIAALQDKMEWETGVRRIERLLQERAAELDRGEKSFLKGRLGYFLHFIAMRSCLRPILHSSANSTATTS